MKEFNWYSFKAAKKANSNEYRYSKMSFQVGEKNRKLFFNYPKCFNLSAATVSKSHLDIRVWTLVGLLNVLLNWIGLFHQLVKDAAQAFLKCKLYNKYQTNMILSNKQMPTACNYKSICLDTWLEKLLNHRTEKKNTKGYTCMLSNPPCVINPLWGR